MTVRQLEPLLNKKISISRFADNICDKKQQQQQQQVLRIDIGFKIPFHFRTQFSILPV